MNKHDDFKIFMYTRWDTGVRQFDLGSFDFVDTKIFDFRLNTISIVVVRHYLDKNKYIPYSEHVWWKWWQRPDHAWFELNFTFEQLNNIPDCGQLRPCPITVASRMCALKNKIWPQETSKASKIMFAWDSLDTWFFLWKLKLKSCKL